jgi:hypothetical protein
MMMQASGRPHEFPRYGASREFHRLPVFLTVADVSGRDGVAIIGTKASLVMA